MMTMRECLKRRVRVRAFANSALVSLSRARFLLREGEQTSKRPKKTPRVGKKKRETREKKIEMYSHHHHLLYLVFLFLAKGGESSWRREIFFFSLSLCVSSRLQQKLRTRFLNRKVYMFNFVISDIIKIQVGCARISQDPSKLLSFSLFSMCVCVCNINCVSLFFCIRTFSFFN